jgi:hypothetical protein
VRDLFTTQRFTPGHVLGAGLLVFGVIGGAGALIDKAQRDSLAAQAGALRTTRGARFSL